MVISFEKKDRKIIESKGITIIEFKRILYNTEKTIEDTRQVLKEITDKITKAWNVFVENFLEAVDNVKLMINQIREAYHYPTSRRYRIVKIFGKYTGTDIRFNWRMTFKIKRWIARSCC